MLASWRGKLLARMAALGIDFEAFRSKSSALRCFRWLFILLSERLPTVGKAVSGNVPILPRESSLPLRAKVISTLNNSAQPQTCPPSHPQPGRPTRQPHPSPPCQQNFFLMLISFLSSNTALLAMILQRIASAAQAHYARPLAEAHLGDHIDVTLKADRAAAQPSPILVESFSSVKNYANDRTLDH